MECTLAIDAELLKSPLRYKYVIYSPKATKEDDHFEKLHPCVTFWKNDPNRCLCKGMNSMLSKLQLVRILSESETWF